MKHGGAKGQLGTQEPRTPQEDAGTVQLLQGSAVGLMFAAHLVLITSATTSCGVTVTTRPLRPQAGLQGTTLGDLSGSPGSASLSSFGSQCPSSSARRFLKEGDLCTTADVEGDCPLTWATKSPSLRPFRGSPDHAVLGGGSVAYSRPSWASLAQTHRAAPG